MEISVDEIGRFGYCGIGDVRPFELLEEFACVLRLRWATATSDLGQPIPQSEIEARADDPRKFMAWLRKHTLSLRD